MKRDQRAAWLPLFGGALMLALVGVQAQSGGSLQGRVTRDDGEAVHHATVMIVETGATAETDHDGLYTFENISPGTYELFAFVASLTSQAQMAGVRSGESTRLDFVLQLSPIRQSVTVTARGRHETTFQTVQSVRSMDSFDVAEKLAPSLGEVLEGESGVAKRSFGPGSARPVIRGFDGDRVLVMKDGMPIGSLGSQSGDHGEPIDPAHLERVEVVKGPATLLYGSNAIGGVVNAITRHHEMHKHRHEGYRGQAAASTSSNMGLAGGSVTVEYGKGNWMAWGGGGGQRTGDYSSAQGSVENSQSRISNGSGGFGWFGDRLYLSLDYDFADGRYGIPFAQEFHEHDHETELLGSLLSSSQEEDEQEVEEVDVDWRQHNLRLSGGLQDLGGFLDAVRLNFNVSQWNHNELDVLASGEEEVGTAFDNRQYVYRADFDQKPGKLLSGSFGVWGMQREYESTGAEALSPPVSQDGIAFFALEEWTYERLKLQFGGRVEHARYQPKGPCTCPQDSVPTLEALPERSFTGFSLGAGSRIDLWSDGALVGNFTSSYRTPALEELYNYGPHVGNLAFEIGNPNLKGERSNGFDLSLRHSGETVQGEVNFFYYAIQDFIFAAPTGEFQDGLVEVRYLQGNSRFVGAEASVDFAVNEVLWVNLGMDTVKAELTDPGTPLPRIPPLRGRAGLDLRLKGFSFRPELEMASSQESIFPTETRTAGYSVGNLKASYTLPQQHFVHHFFLEVFNVGDTLYRNHLSFIKELAPEMGRGVRFSYALKFF